MNMYINGGQGEALMNVSNNCWPRGGARCRVGGGVSCTSLFLSSASAWSTADAGSLSASKSAHCMFSSTVLGEGRMTSGTLCSL